MADVRGHTGVVTPKPTARTPLLTASGAGDEAVRGRQPVPVAHLTSRCARPTAMMNDRKVAAGPAGWTRPMAMPKTLACDEPREL
eukprot:4632721-Prymnesium_polylepis.1